MWDVIIVGAGVVGSYLARRIAERKRRVLLIDRLKNENLGGWKNSGHNIDKIVFQRLPIKPPSADELGAEVEFAHYDSPGQSFDFRLPMYNVRLGPFTQRVLDDAIRAGVEFMGETACASAIVEDGFVKGVKAKKAGSEIELRASITVDVSGIEAVVRNSLPDEMGVEKGLNPDDVINVYSEDREVGTANWPVPFTYHARYQGWSGPRRPGVVGIGLGRFASTGEDPREIHEEFAKYALKVQGKTIYRTYQRVPVRYPLGKLVGNGFMALGDAAYQGKPLNGEGISVMLDAAELAANTAVGALLRKDFSEKSLWPYSMVWSRTMGSRFAPFHRLRAEILPLSKEDQNFLLGLGIYGPREMSSVMLEGKIALGPRAIVNLARVAYRGRSRPDLLKKLAAASIEGMKLKRLYTRYPSEPGGLREWMSQIESVIQKQAQKKRSQ